MNAGHGIRAWRSWLIAGRVLIIPAGIIVCGLLLHPLLQMMAAILAPLTLFGGLARPLNAVRTLLAIGGLTAAAAAGATLTALGILLCFGKVGPFWLMFIMCWFTWLLPPVLILLAGYRLWQRRTGTAGRLGTAFGFAVIAWVFQGLILFDWSRPVGNGDPQIYDHTGLLGVNYPKPREQAWFVCLPTGPSFLWSADYSGDEWIFTIFRPHIKVWLWLYRESYFEL